MSREDDKTGQPETWVSVYHTEHGPVIPGRQWIPDLIAAGDYDLAYQLIREQATQHATRVLRAAGCSFERLDAIARTDLEAATSDLTSTNMDRLHDVVEFMLKNPDASAEAKRADQALHDLFEQQAKVRDAGDLDRQAVRSLVMMSMALGYQAAVDGNLGSEPPLKTLEEARAGAEKGLRNGRERVRQRSNQWREPLEAYIISRVKHERPANRARGMVAKYLLGFRKAHPEARLPGSNIPNTITAQMIDAAILVIHRVKEG